MGLVTGRKGKGSMGSIGNRPQSRPYDRVFTEWNFVGGRFVLQYPFLPKEIEVFRLGWRKSPSPGSWGLLSYDKTGIVQDPSSCPFRVTLV